MAMREEPDHGERLGGSKAEKPIVTPARIVVALLVLVFLWWCFTNRQSVTVTLLITDRDLPLFVVLLVAFAIGLATGALLWSRRAARKARAALPRK